MAREWVGVRGGGAADPGAERAGALVGAYFDVEGATGLRRIVCRTAAIVGLAGWTVETTTSILTRVDLAFGAGLLAIAVVATAAAEWRIRRQLTALMNDERCTRRPTMPGRYGR
jgi:hypothetical protein